MSRKRRTKTVQKLLRQLQKQSFPGTGNLDTDCLAISLGAGPIEPKFPSLFYLFPVADHFHDGEASATALVADPDATVIQPSTEPYIDEDYIFDTSVTTDVNHNVLYTVLDDTNSNGIEDGTKDSIEAIDIQPRSLVNWQLAYTTTTTDRVNIIRDNISSQDVGIGLLDKGMFNGREMMSVRTLDFDLDLPTWPFKDGVNLQSETPEQPVGGPPVLVDFVDDPTSNADPDLPTCDTQYNRLHSDATNYKSFFACVRRINTDSGLGANQDIVLYLRGNAKGREVITDDSFLPTLRTRVTLRGVIDKFD
ncbi:MAG: hypothetical protein AB4426_01600 [Xenococcaceae cyanobacterium]